MFFFTIPRISGILELYGTILLSILNDSGSGMHYMQL